MKTFAVKFRQTEIMETTVHLEASSEEKARQLARNIHAGQVEKMMELECADWDLYDGGIEAVAVTEISQ